MRVMTDKFNSDIFGIKMGNIIDVSLCCTSEDVRQLIEQATLEQYKHLNVKVNSKDKVSTNAFLQNGFELVDTQLMYCIRTNDYLVNGTRGEKVHFRKYQEGDKEQIINIAKTSYAIDQYHSDLGLDNDLCDIYYSEWIKNCCDGLADKVMVAVLPNNKVIGYITLDYQENQAVVGLAAVQGCFRGRGFFTFLMDNTLRMLYKENIKWLFYGTQLSNIPVLKTMGHFGGFINYSNHVMHFMI